MLTSFYRKWIIPGFEAGLKRRRIFAYLRELETSQWLAVEELTWLQQEALRLLLRYAQSNCPYYRSEWSQRGLHADDLVHPESFLDWPVIDRETVRKHRAQMRSTLRGAKFLSKATGGSSGVPLQFDLCRDKYDRSHAAWHRGYSWAGAGPGTRQLYLWGVALERQSRRQQLRHWLYQRALYRRHILNSFDFADHMVPEFVQRINRFRPEAIVAYTSPIYLLARAIEERGLRVFAPRSIIVGAEKLHDFQRQAIERVFGVPVFETYGSREFMLIGAECERHQGLHLTAEHLLVEILDDDGTPTPAGEEGNVVITDLCNYGMPFIRYANGDRAVAGWGQCSCGRGLPLLARVVGRQLDVLSTPDGRRIPGEFFPHLIKDYAAVTRFQVVQEAIDTIELKLVVASGWSSSESSRLERQIRDAAGGSVQLKVRTVNEIPLSRSGKHQVVVNRCSSVRECTTAH